MSFKITNESIFDTKADAYVNTVNCIGVMGAGIALEFKNRFPTMFQHYRQQCKEHRIRPGDCYVYFDKENKQYLLGLAVKDDWRHWSTLEWIESSLNSLKLVILENDIKSVNLPLPGGKNGRRGPFGKVLDLTPPPGREELKAMMQERFEEYCDKFKIDINLCIPDEIIKPKKEELTIDAFIQ